MRVSYSEGVDSLVGGVSTDEVDMRDIYKNKNNFPMKLF